MMKKILIGSKKSKESVNVDNFISVDLSAKQREILITNVNESVDSDDVYNNERDESTAYRAIFTINPICTNVLFNAITEVVYDDGGKNAIKVPKGEIVNGKISTNSSLEPPINAKNKERLYGRQVIRDTEYSHPDIGDYTYYCGIDIFNNHILRSTDFNLVSKRDGEMYKNKSNISDDTVIECNYPLANNENVTYTIEDTFNSIRDYVRDRNGEPVSEMYFNRKNLYMSNGKPYSNINDIPRQVIHNYQADNLMSFYESYTTNLIEKDGWFGFNNPSKLDIPNYIINGKEAIINKCINSEKSCSFIDLYPDRSLFSFIPKVNKKRNNRIEKNWDYCLTYPYRNDYNNELISDIDEELNALYVNSVTLTKFNNKWLLTFSSCIPHNLKITSFIQLYVKDLDSDNEKYVKIPIKSKIYNLGTVQKTDKKYSFTIDGTNVIEYFTNEDIENDPGNYTLKPHLQCRFTKIVNGYECEYYIRILRKIPNFRFAKERIEDIEPDKLKNYIEEYQNTNFDSIINKLAFSENIYTDKLAQIVFIDDINVNELTDNLNRPLSEIYLTIVKANRGHDLWYPEYDKDNPISPVYNDEKIEYSHAFSKVTSGFDLGRRITYNESGTSSTDTTIYCSKIEDNNVHMLHNVNLNQLNNDDLGINGSDVEFRMNSDLFNIPNSAKPLEDNIMVDVDDDNPVEFGCDIVEFSPSEVIESSLCEVNHRFNTAQRECINNEYCDMFFDTIANDDYDVGVLDESDVDTYDCPFKIIEELYNMTEKKEKFYANIFPEGYIYRPHYKIKIAEFSNNVEQGQDTIVSFSKLDENIVYDNGTLSIKTNANYYFEVGDNIIFINKDNANDIKNGVINKVENLRKLYFTLDNTLKENGTSMTEHEIKAFIKNSRAFKPNVTIPSYATSLKDGSGRYVWRNMVKPSELSQDSDIYDMTFANGSFYIYEQINFFLRRQDPFGEYGLKYTSGKTGSNNSLLNFSVDGNKKDIVNYEYVKENEMKC